MKFLHVSDLHIGKIVNDFSMLEDQRFILEQIAGMAVANQVDAVVIAGDIYDRAIPTGEAVMLFDSFLTRIVDYNIRIIMISGNHDSAERVSFGKELLNARGVHIAGIQENELTEVVIKKKRGRKGTNESKEYETEFVLLPFVKAAQVEAANSGEAVKKLLAAYWEKEKKRKRTEKKNRVLVTHFFVTDAGREPELSDSETTIHVGGLDNVDASLFEGFDYVALGHIHKMQQIGERPVWYSGAPLKYSFGETTQTKGALLVSLEEEGKCEVHKLILRPLHEFRKMKGSLQELLRQGQCAGAERFDYLQAILTDKGELIDPIGTLRSVYPNIMQLVREEDELTDSGAVRMENREAIATVRKDALTMFEEFYLQVREEVLQAEGKQIVAELVKELEE